MDSINVMRGDLRIIDRDNIYEDVMDLYKIGEILGECPINIKYSDEQAIDDGGVQRDMFSGYWEEAYSKLFDGSAVLIPMIHPHMDMTDFMILGRILSHGYLVSGHLPVRIALPTLINMVLGPTKIPAQILLNAFLDYISSAERAIFKDALNLRSAAVFPNFTKDTLVDTLSRFGCRQVPTPDKLMSTIKCIAEYEFMIKPAAAISLVHSGIPTAHRSFWSQKTVSGVSALYDSLTVSAARIRKSLMSSSENNSNAERVYGYFTTMIDNSTTEDLRSLLRFITGSSICSASDILVVYNSLSGLSRRPIAHTCDSTIELSTTYLNYADFHSEFQAIFSKVNKEYTFRMDAL